jgi:hypothetical protein
LYLLEPGDSIDFDSVTPHRLRNPFSEPVVAIWIVVDRQGDDGRRRRRLGRRCTGPLRCDGSERPVEELVSRFPHSRPANLSSE